MSLPSSLSRAGSAGSFGRRVALSAALSAALWPLAGQARAAGFPTRPIRLVVGFAPGGAVDLVARALAEEMGRTLGQAVIVDNRTGASGNVGAAEVVRATPDGHTLLLGNGPQLAINPFLFTTLAFDPARDLVPIGQAATVRFIAVVPAQGAARDLAGLVAQTRARPGTYGSSGAGSIQHLGTELFKAASGALLTHVPYRGSSPMIVDVLGGRLDFAIDAESVVAPHVAAGALRALATMGPNRAAGLPDVPTIAEAGYGDISVEGWQGLVAPARTPQDVLATLGTALRDALAQPQLRQRLTAASIVPAYRDAAGFADFLGAERQRWGREVRTLGLTL